MKKFVVHLITAFLIVNVQSGFLDGWSDFSLNLQSFGRQLTQDLQEQGKAIEQEAQRYAKQAQEEERKAQEEVQRQQNEVMEIVNQIEAGNLPSGVNSANSSTLTQKVNDRILTVKTTIYSTGNEQKGVICNVQSISDGTKTIDWSVNSLIWDGNQLKKRFVQSASQSKNNQYENSQSVVINSGSVLNTGGSSFISTQQGGMIVQEITL